MYSITTCLITIGQSRKISGDQQLPKLLSVEQNSVDTHWEEQKPSKMAALSSAKIPILSSSRPIPKILSKKSESRVRVSNQKPASFAANSRLYGELGGRRRASSPPGRLNAAGFAEVEPDLNEDPVDPWATLGVSEVLWFSLSYKSVSFLLLGIWILNSELYN